MTVSKVNIGRAILVSVTFYLALIAFHGYRFGDEDMTETLSYALYLWDHSLYPKDLYIQAVAASAWNERFIYTWFLSRFHPYLEITCFILHAIGSILFIIALDRLARRYIDSQAFQQVFILLFLFLFYQINLGGNEAWYNYLMPSQLAKLFGIWAIVFYVEEKTQLALLLLIPATLMQPIVGAQLSLLFVITILWRYYETKTVTSKTLWSMGALAATAGVWLTIVAGHQLMDGNSMEGGQFLDIMELRLGHHFFPSYFPLKSWLLLTPLILLGAWIWRPMSQRIFRFFSLSIGIAIFYTLLIEVFRLPQAVGLQWFKVTVWLKMLSLLAISSWVASRVDSKDLMSTRAINVALLALAMFCVLEISGVFDLVKNRPNHLPGTGYENSAMMLGIEADRRLKEDVCIIVPPDVTGLRYFSKRSIFIDYKSNIHSRSYLAEASRRREKLYGITLDLRRKGFDPVVSGSDYYHALSTSDFMVQAQRGATHVLVEKPKKLDLIPVIENEQFSLYEL